MELDLPSVLGQIQIITVGKLLRFDRITTDLWHIYFFLLYFMPTCNRHGVKCNFLTCFASLWDSIPVKSRTFCGRLKVTGCLEGIIIRRPRYYKIISTIRYHTTQIFMTFNRSANANHKRFHCYNSASTQYNVYRLVAYIKRFNRNKSKALYISWTVKNRLCTQMINSPKINRLLCGQKHLIW